MKALCAGVIVATLAVGAAWAQGAPAETDLVSADRSGRATGTNAELGGISGTGRFVAYDARSSDIVKGDTNGARDVFVWDRETGRTERVNVSSGGRQTARAGCSCKISSRVRAISDDGDSILFVTSSPSLVRSDDDEGPDGFVHDRSTGRTTLVTVGGDDTASGDAVAISSDGRFVVYHTLSGDDPGAETYVWDRETDERTHVSAATSGHGAFHGHVASISTDGDKVTFVSVDPRLVDDFRAQVFVLDRSDGIIEQVSVSSDEEPANGYSGGGDMSPDGRYVLFESSADNLVGVGQDTNFYPDVFVRDLEAGTTSRVTVAEMGLQPDGASWAGEISDDGCRAALDSEASNLVPHDTNSSRDVFVFDRCVPTATRISVATTGAQGNRISYGGALSGDGRWAAFQSKASTLSPDDHTKKIDVFLRGPLS